VHSKEQIIACGESGGKSRSQHSQFGRSSSIFISRPGQAVGEPEQGRAEGRHLVLRPAKQVTERFLPIDHNQGKATNTGGFRCRMWGWPWWVVLDRGCSRNIYSGCTRGCPQGFRRADCAAFSPSGQHRLAAVGQGVFTGRRQSPRWGLTKPAKSSRLAHCMA